MTTRLNCSGRSDSIPNTAVRVDRAALVRESRIAGVRLAERAIQFSLQMDETQG
ncbi:MAG: hypothetical protein KDA83_20935 [Planctomycetales bacterium]|nr:hypothetical protein [Planctomycetales bacterium]